jgi:hypothetical protein
MTRPLVGRIVPPGDISQPAVPRSTLADADAGRNHGGAGPVPGLAGLADLAGTPPSSRPEH